MNIMLHFIFLFIEALLYLGKFHALHEVIDHAVSMAIEKGGTENTSTGRSIESSQKLDQID